MQTNITTLTDYLAQHSQSANINHVIGDISRVAIQINRLLRQGALADIQGEAGNQNVQGEEQKNLM